MDLLGKTATAFAGYKGMKGGIKAVAAVAAGRWLYNKWQSNRSMGTRSSSSTNV